MQMTIGYNKSKALKLFLGSILFVFLGLHFVFYSDTYDRHSPLTMQILGWITIVFFGLGIYVSVRMFFQKTPTFEINWEGIRYDLKKASSFIPWQDIEGFSETEIHKQQIILIHLVNPSDYISRESNPIKKKLLEFNYEHYKTPICILPSMYNISLNQLMANFEKYAVKKHGI